MKLSGIASLGLPFWLNSCYSNSSKYPVTFDSDHKVGHLLFESNSWKVKQTEAIDLAIVGGGISGLTAAVQNRNLNYKVFELSSRVGGSSSATQYQNIKINQGAHYDLAYPTNYGNHVLEFLNDLNIIRYEKWRNTWGFVDSQYIIPFARRQKCFDHGVIRPDVIPEGDVKNRFVELIESYSGKMVLPTSSIEEAYRHLNEVSFFDFLQQEQFADSEFFRQINYHMYDDYGGDSQQVSALAGILYFACRPYYKQAVDLFSPPNGNDYFVQKMLGQLDGSKVKTNHLVQKIESSGNEFQVSVLHIENKEVEEFKAKEVIYAGQKHALKYIAPSQAPLFSTNYAPWMVVNFVTNQQQGKYGVWQNEVLGSNPQFLGFIDSSVQNQNVLQGKQVFTAYYCLKEEDRAYLLTVEENKRRVANETLDYIEQALGRKIEVEACFIKVMGHAMPIPKPGYLFQDANQHPDAQLKYAGVDNGRLPLLFEALDSGIQAAALV